MEKGADKDVLEASVEIPGWGHLEKVHSTFQIGTPAASKHGIKDKGATEKNARAEMRRNKV